MTDLLYAIILIIISIPIGLISNRQIGKGNWDTINQKISLYGLRALSVLGFFIGVVLLFKHIF